MCLITEKFDKSETFTGYKVVIKRDGKYYSPATGIEYKPGSVPKLDANTDRNVELIRVFSYSFKNFRDLIYRAFFNPTFNGLTAVFVDESAARRLLDEFSQNLDGDQVVIVSMTIYGNLHRGLASCANFTPPDTAVIAGNTIVKFEQLEP